MGLYQGGVRFLGATPIGGDYNLVTAEGRRLLAALPLRVEMDEPMGLRSSLGRDAVRLGAGRWALHRCASVGRGRSDLVPKSHYERETTGNRSWVGVPS